MHLGEHERLDLCGLEMSLHREVARPLEEFRLSVKELLRTGEDEHLYRALANIEQVKSVLQQMHNINHRLAIIAAKFFLQRKFPSLPWTQVQFARHPNARGPDIVLPDGSVRIVAEVKTTRPCALRNRSYSGFSTSQKEAIIKDLEKLSSPRYDGYARYMFVTHPLAYHCLNRDYHARFPSVCIVLLSARPEVSRPLTGATLAANAPESLGD
jgi:hypothetical protein